MDRCKREANVERDRETERVLGGGGGSGEGGEGGVLHCGPKLNAAFMSNS